MPGSKTFTSSKMLELLEYSLIEEYQKMQKRTSGSKTFSCFIEVAKVCFSTMLSSVFVLNANLSKIFSLEEPEGLIKAAAVLGIKICVVFLLGYILASLLLSKIIFLVNSIFNSRLTKKTKERSKQTFCHITANLIMLAVSFERKCYAYHKEEGSITNELERNAWMDLEIKYFIQAISYFELAGKRLQDAIPDQMKFCLKEKVNQKFEDYIGFDNLIIHITIALQSMDRLKNFYSNVEGPAVGLEKLYQRINKFEYEQPIKNQGQFLDELIDEYKYRLDLVISRKEKYEQKF
jgi:hypothetical protein